MWQSGDPIRYAVFQCHSLSFWVLNSTGKEKSKNSCLNAVAKLICRRIKINEVLEESKQAACLGVGLLCLG